MITPYYSTRKYKKRKYPVIVESKNFDWDQYDQRYLVYRKLGQKKITAISGKRVFKKKGIKYPKKAIKRGAYPRFIQAKTKQKARLKWWKSQAEVEGYKIKSKQIQKLNVTQLLKRVGYYK